MHYYVFFKCDIWTQTESLETRKELIAMSKSYINFQVFNLRQ
jgi:hypothetical protein